MELVELQTRLTIATEAMAESARRIAVALEERNKPYVPTREEREVQELQFQKMREERDREERQKSEAVLMVVKGAMAYFGFQLSPEEKNNG